MVIELLSIVQLQDQFFRKIVKLLTPLIGLFPNTPTSLTAIVLNSGFMLEVAEHFKIPNVFLCPVNACAYMAVIHYQELQEKGLMPLDAEEELNSEYLNTSIDWIPGLKGIRLKDIPQVFSSMDPDRTCFNLLKYESQRAHQASAIILNTFNDLEARVLDAISVFLPLIYSRSTNIAMPPTPEQ